MLSSCLSLWQSHIVKCTWGPHWEGRHLKLPALRKGWKSPQCACQQVCLEAQHNGTLVPLLHRGHSRNPSRSSLSWFSAYHKSSVCSFTHNQEREELSLLPPRDWWPRRESPDRGDFPFLLLLPGYSLLPQLGQVSAGGRESHLCHCPDGSRANCSLMGYYVKNLRSKEEEE